jgi:hypothetical protein
VLAARIERNKEASNCKSAKLSFRSSSRESGAKREETEIATIVATYLVHGVSVQSGLKLAHVTTQHPRTHQFGWMLIGKNLFLFIFIGFLYLSYLPWLA